MIIYLPQITGNVCRLAFAHPKAFAKMLKIPAYVVEFFAAILAVINQEEAVIDPDKFESFCNSFLDWFFASEFSWNYQSSTVSNFKNHI